MTTIVPSTDTAWSVKPHNNKRQRLLVISHRPVRLSCSITALWKSGPCCATLGSREQLSAKPFRRSLRDRAAISVYVRVALRPLPSFAATRGQLHSCVVLLDSHPLSIPPPNPLYRATLAPQQQTRQQQDQLRLDKLERCLGSRFSSTAFNIKSANAIHVAYQ